MEPFCTVAEYRARYPDDTTDDAVLLEVLLEATDLMCGEMDESDVEYVAQGEDFTNRLKRICRAVAHRAIGSRGDGDSSDLPFGAEQLSESSENFSATVKWANPYEDVFLTSAERRALGIGRSKACVISPYA